MCILIINKISLRMIKTLYSAVKFSEKVVECSHEWTNEEHGRWAGEAGRVAEVTVADTGSSCNAILSSRLAFIFISGC